MAESPTQQAESTVQQPPSPRNDQVIEYWCHQCNRRVNGETLADNQVVCSECNGGFLVSIAPTPTTTALQHAIQTLELLEQAANLSQPSNRVYANDERRGVPGGTIRSAEVMRRLRQSYRESIQNSGLGVVGNYGDYADDAEYQSILLNLADSDDGANRGAPPAAESAVAALKNVKIKSEKEAILCVVCKDLVTAGQTSKELPCGHGYHGDCIMAWLATRNMCPVCRYELPTNDPDYEDERVKKNSGGSPKAGNHLPAGDE
ncbi:E3 ubiquitin-protein ligase CIP8-like [Apium graveolens]|uniref:E3 ubiquitin-protein ligase CIP8-like n=1 Tax=Apium graveolens TaxID=4045 RepID=UPI003D7C0FF3